MDSLESMQNLNSSQISINMKNSAQSKLTGSPIIEMKEVTHAIRQVKVIINQSVKADHTVIFWGFSGTGKSSAIITLNGQQILGYHEGEPILIEANPTKDKRGVKIETLVTAGTIYPAFLELKCQGANQKVMLWDMPGIGQTRGATQSLINSYFIHRIFEFQTSIKLVFAIEFSQIVPNKRGAHLQKTLTDLTKVLGDFQNYQQAVAIMITKVPPLNNEGKIIGFFQQILVHLPSVAQNSRLRFLLEKLIKKQIPLILSKQPNLSNNFLISKQNAVNVTSQYTAFRKQMYMIITSKLKSASFPKLYSPAMSSNEIIKCKPIVEETHRQINENIEIIKNQVQKFIIDKLQPINISFNMDQFRNGLEKYNRVLQFVGQISKMTNYILKQAKKQQRKAIFDQLKHFLEVHRFLTRLDDQGIHLECTPMANLNDNYIMIKFLNTFSFEGTEIQIKWKDQSEIIHFLFKNLFDCQLHNILSEFTRKFNQKVRMTVKADFSIFLQSLQKENAYQIWAKQFKIFPALVLSFSTFDTSANHLKYFQNLIKQLKRTQFSSNTSSVQNILNMLTLKDAYIPQPKPIEFLNSQIKQTCAIEGRKLINKAVGYEGWDKQYTKHTLDQYMNQKKKASGNQKELLNKLQIEQRLHQKSQKRVEALQMLVAQKDKMINQLLNSKKNQKKDSQQEQICCHIY